MTIINIENCIQYIMSTPTCQHKKRNIQMFPRPECFEVNIMTKIQSYIEYIMPTTICQHN